MKKSTYHVSVGLRIRRAIAKTAIRLIFQMAGRVKITGNKITKATAWFRELGQSKFAAGVPEKPIPMVVDLSFNLRS